MQCVLYISWSTGHFVESLCFKSYVACVAFLATFEAYLHKHQRQAALSSLLSTCNQQCRVVPVPGHPCGTATTS